MSEIYPVICWRLPDGWVAGQLVGTQLQLVRDDERGVTSGLQAELAHHQGFTSVREARLVRKTVEVRPCYHEGHHRFFSPEPVPLAVDVVVGRTASGWLCWLPRLGCSFGCSEESLLDTLIVEEIISWSRQASPHRIYAELRVAPAWLAEIPARRKELSARTREARQMPDTLLQVAEREPTRKRKLEPGAWSRDACVAAVQAHLLARRNLVLVGEPSVGKSTILREAISRAAEAEEARTFWRTTTHRIIAGARYLGEWQERADRVALALQAANGTLWVEDLLELFMWGGRPEESIAAYWRGLLREGRLHLVGELLPRAWEVVHAALPDVARSFEVIPVEELGVDATREIIDRFAGLMKTSAQVELPADARRRAIRLLERFDRYERFPGKAIRFVNTLLSGAERKGRSRIEDADVVAAFERKTGLPRKLVDDLIPLRASEIEEALGQRIVHQPAALSALSRVLLSWKAGLNDPDRPVSTLLFAGPTGVGKTATARALAEYCYGAGARRTPLVRVDMSELGSPWQVERLLGSRREAGAILRQIRERPFSVLLLDEIEKAHPLFFDLLLGVLDEGRLVDTLGRETDFRGSILIMTTNLGTRRGRSLGFPRGEADSIDTSAIRAFFRPEFYNRIDEVVCFSPLDRDAVRAIALRELAALEEREGFRGRAISLSFTDAVVDLVVSAGFDPMFGARPLQRAIEQHVVSALAKLLVDEGRLLAADLQVDVEAGAVVVRRR